MCYIPTKDNAYIRDLKLFKTLKDVVDAIR